MTRYVIDPGVAIKLAATQTKLNDTHRLVAPTLLRSQTLSILYGQVRRGELTKQEADGYLDHIRSLKIRLLGDRVLQANAWKIAAELGWDDTFTAEYVALTRLQADAFITLDTALADEVKDLVTVVSIDVL